MNELEFITTLPENEPMETFEAFKEHEDEKIRTEIARRGHFLSLYANDSHKKVRKEVAKHGYALEILVHDKAYEVRMEVAKHDYRLDLLINDKSKAVQEIAKKVAEDGFLSVLKPTKTVIHQRRVKQARHKKQPTRTQIRQLETIYQVQALKEHGYTPKEIANLLRKPITTVYRYLTIGE